MVASGESHSAKQPSYLWVAGHRRRFSTSAIRSRCAAVTIHVGRDRRRGAERMHFLLSPHAQQLARKRRHQVAGLVEKHRAAVRGVTQPAPIVARMAERVLALAEPVALDLLKIKYYADDIPPNLPLVSSVQSIDYARTRIGERSVILPQSASMDMLQTSGEESRNLLEFTHCQAFAADSTLSWNAPEPVSAALPARPAPQADALPAGLTVTLELAAPVTVTDPVGSEIQARVAFDVKDKRRIVVPAGASAADAFGAWSALQRRKILFGRPRIYPTSRPPSGRRASMPTSSTSKNAPM